MSKSLILGSDGFIGSYLREALLARGEEVVGLDQHIYRTNSYDKRYPFIWYRIKNDELSMNVLRSVIKEHKIDFAWNLIAIANPSYYVLEPIETFNLDFTINYEIGKVLNELQVPFMQFSTSEVYGKTWEEDYVEDTSNLVLGPTHKQRWIYANSKILLEQLFLAHHKRGEAEVAIVRPQNFIGPGIDWISSMQPGIDNKWKPRVFSCFMDNIFKDKPLQVVLPGTQRRCYTYIDDAIDGLLSIYDNWEKCKGEVFNVGNRNNEIEIFELAGMVINAYKEITNEETYGIEYVDGEQFYGEGYEDCERRLFCDNKMKTKTGFEPQISKYDTIYKSVQGTLDLFALQYKYRK